MKRLYKQANAVDADDGFGVALDGNLVKTPAGAAFLVPSSALASALAQEWQAQGDQVHPASMKLTQLVSTAIDRILPDPDKIVAGLVSFGESDLLCYRALHPSDLKERQASLWQPLLDWAERCLSVRLAVTEGVLPIKQSKDSQNRLRQHIQSCDHWTLAALVALAPALGSVILALAVVERRLDADEAVDLAQLDEKFQAERWGVDPEAAERLDGLRREVEAAARFLVLMRKREK